MLSGILLAFAYFPFQLVVFNFIAFAPMLAWIDAHLEDPRRERLRGGLVFGLTFYLMILHWMYAMLEVSWLAVLLYLLLSFVLASCVMLALSLVGWLRRATGWSFAILLPVSWIPIEWAGTWGDLRLTAHHVGNTLAGTPFLVQFADVVGPYGVGAFLLAVNALVYEVFRGRRNGRWKGPAFSLAVLLLSVLGYDTWAWTHPPPTVGTIRVALVQPNIPLFEKMDSKTDHEQSRILADATRRAATSRPELIVWPETARPQPILHRLSRRETYTMPEVEALARETGAAILVGAEYARIDDQNEMSYYNAAFVVHPAGEVDPVWTAKVYLVPFVEKVPYEPILGPLLSGGQGEMRWLGGGFSPGPDAALLPVDRARVGVLVCYEELYWDLVRRLKNAGADFQVIITNDAWFGRTVFQQYQANTVRMRAIENRCAFVRVANTGISGFVDPLGRYSKETALFVPAVEVEDVPITTKRTIYGMLGDFVAWLALAGLAAAAVVARSKERRGK
jgi:apolipoprotein N-acyltransferase